MKLPVIFAILTALCWGLYAPVLAQSRRFLDSPFKPYVAIGIAYLVWGIGGGIVGMLQRKESFSFSGPGVMWGFAGGTLGAWGALTLTMAIYNKGDPHTVMPIVFGGAVTVTALASVWTKSEQTTVSPFLWLGIAGIIVCATIVAYFTPHPKPPAKATAASTSTEAPP